MKNAGAFDPPPTEKQFVSDRSVKLGVALYMFTPSDAGLGMPPEMILLIASRENVSWNAFTSVGPTVDSSPRTTDCERS